MLYSVLRTLKYAIKDFYRNIWLSLVTITVLILALLSVNILVSLQAVSDAVVTSVKNKVDISVFFKQDIEQAQIDNFRTRIANMEEVKDAVYISKDDALSDFKEKHKDDPKILEAIREINQNPLTDSLVIRAKNTEDYDQILSVLRMQENQDIIKYQNYTDHETIISQVNSVSSKVENFSLGLTMVFVFISVLIVFNAIRVTIYTHKEEINMMKLVGATNSFIRMPFLIESVLFSVFAVFLGGGLIYVILYSIEPYMTPVLSPYSFNLMTYYTQNWITIFGGQLLAVIVLNMISSGIAVGKYLKV